MNQVGEIRFLEQWNDTVDVAGAHFGILNSLETGAVEIMHRFEKGAWNRNEYIDFLFGVVHEEADGKHGAKGLQFLLKLATDGVLPDDARCENILEVLRWPEICKAVQREPLSRMAWAFLNKYHSDRILPELIQNKRWVPQLSAWIKAVFADEKLDLLDAFAYVSEPGLLDEVIQMVEGRIHKALACDLDSRSVRTLSALAQQSDRWRAPIKLLLYLRAARGDFDQMVSVRG